MARDHACVPWEYLDEMEALHDSEFGRLMRALLRYSMTGEPIALKGNERFYAKRVMSREDRYQESYKKQSATNAANGANGGRPSKNGGGKPASDKSNGNRKKPEETEIKRNKADESEKTHTDTYTDTNTDTNATSGSTSLPPAADPELARAMTEILNFIPQLSPLRLEKFKAYYQSLGADVCVLAVYEARDNSINGRGAWAYIEAILNRCQNSGIRSQVDWEADKARRKSSSQRTGRNAAPTTEDYGGEGNFHL